MSKERNKKTGILIVFFFWSLLSLTLILIFNNNSDVSNVDVNAGSYLNFPRDHSVHSSFNKEWWYINLLTKSTKTDGSNEKDIGYVISFSKIEGQNGLLSSRYDSSNNSFKEKTDTGGTLNVSLLSNKYLYITYSSGSTNATLEEKLPGSDRKKVYSLKGYTPQIGNFDLILKERTVPTWGSTSPLLWGGYNGDCKGRISVFMENDTYYYSIPDLDISGSITDIDGTTRIINIGKAWIDHQWFNSFAPNDWKGHYWSSFHYTYSGDLWDTGTHEAVAFVTQIYNDGPRYTYWVKRNSDGRNECGVGGKIDINNYWGNNYQSAYKLKLNKSNNLFFEANGVSTSSNQIFKPSGLPSFYEPVAYFSGRNIGRSFSGLGFFETHLNKFSSIDKNYTTLVIKGMGTYDSGYPILEILIDDKTITSYTTTNYYQNYTYNLPYAINAEQIKIKYSNDYNKRNLWVDKIILNGQEYETEASSTYSTGTWTTDSSCSPGYKQKEILHCNGYLQYLSR